MPIEKVLVIDDEVLMRTFVADTLKRHEVDVSLAESGQKALAMIKDNFYDLIICDMKMPGITGIDVLRKARELSPETIVVVLTAFGSIENAVEATRLGAFNYIIKPCSPDSIEALLSKANEHLALRAENTYLRQQVTPRHNTPDNKGNSIIAFSDQMKQIMSDLPASLRVMPQYF